LVRVVPSWTEPLVAKGSTLIGGPLGAHAVIGRARFWTPLRVILAMAVLTCALGWLFKAPCLQQFQGGDGKLALDWRGNHQYVSLCYTDIVTLWNDHRLAGGGLPYTTSWVDVRVDVRVDGAGTPDQRVHYMDYPVVTGYGLWVLAKLTSRYLALAHSLGVSGPSIVQPSQLPVALPEVLFFDIVAVTMVLAWLCVVWSVHRQRPSRPWDAALVAVSPVVAFHIFTGVDAWAVGLTALGMCALARGRPVGAGVLIGLAAAAKVYPALLLLPVLLVAWRRSGVGAPLLGDRDSGRAFAVAGRVLGSAAAAWAVVNLPVALFQTPGWLEFLRYGVSRRVEPDSIWYALSSFTGWPGFDGVLTPGQSPVRLDMVAIGCFALCCGGLVVLPAKAPRPPRLASLSFLVVAAALLVSKAPNPQFALWLVPLAVLALPHWRLLLAWTAFEAALWIPRMYFYVGENNKGLPEQAYETVVVFRNAVLVVLMVLVVRTVLNPGTDVVPRLGSDDPDWPEPVPAGPVPEVPVSAEPVSAGADVPELDVVGRGPDVPELDVVGRGPDVVGPDRSVEPVTRSGSAAPAADTPGHPA